MKTYEIYNLTTGELLADNLNFDDMPELFGAYIEFYPEDDIIVCCRQIDITSVYVKSIEVGKYIDIAEINRQSFYTEWFNLMDELLVMDNIH